MTNLVATLALVAVTNWTGSVHEGHEVGYVVTNHVATLVYDGRTNTVTLKSELCGGIVTRANVQTWTNTLPFMGIWTNAPLPQYYLGTPNRNTATGDRSYIGGGDGCIMSNVK